ncbi:chemotaxis protein CheA [Vibrio sp. JC009]|uniref:chemotaxis protein CheA n=1 Tax=Vibrio sp. JC009 TaxID=2912314 RepID=UPI0023AE9C49|nr:chemotaxis protein CheA [Vibrio sp. JC009]WED23407.1 chemotaxis protein CheA [Vibrio sp. JC009]
MIPGMEQAVITFVTESKELLEEMEASLLQLEENGAFADDELINSVFRSIHTIKGSAGIFGFEHVVNLTHIAETILSQVRNSETRLDKSLIKLFLSCRDITDELVLNASEDREPDCILLDKSQNLIEALTAYQPDISGAPSSSSTQDSAQDKEEQPDKSSNTKEAQWYISFRPRPHVFLDGIDPLSCIRYLNKLGRIKHLDVIQDQLAGTSDFDPELCYLGFEIAFIGNVSRQELIDVFEFIQSDADITIIPPDSSVQDYISLIKRLPDNKQKVGQILVDAGALTRKELESGLALQNELKETQGKPPLIGSMLSESGSVSPEVIQAAIEKQTIKAGKTIQKVQTLRIENDKLDTLIDQVGEMVITGARTNLLARETGSEPLIEAMELLGRLVENIRDSSLKLRMVKIGNTFNTFRRVVRDIAEGMEKKVILNTKGDETELDKTFLEKISDPLMHIVRNAIDHGIETPEERIKKGKPESGAIVLNSYHDSGSVVIEVSDDGRGIDKTRVLEKALEKGLISEQARLSDREIYALMFEPGFSTAEQVTNISGRGVGLDVVKRNIESLRGEIEIDSEPNQGSTIRIRLPLTLSIIDGFMFEVGGEMYVIPLDTVVECIGLHDVTQECHVRGSHYINLRGEALPFIRLRELFDCHNKQGNDSETLVILQSGKLRAGIVVDTLKGELQTVIKPLGQVFRQLKCFSGATILGNSDVAMILDVPALVRLATSVHEKNNNDTGLALSQEESTKHLDLTAEPLTA